MEEVTWFFEDEDGKCVASVQMGIDDMRYAVQYLKNDVENGRYILGYKKEDGTKRVFKGSRQIVNHIPEKQIVVQDKAEEQEEQVNKKVKKNDTDK